MSKKFALIGAAGYIAPRHFKAIKETGNTLIAAFDIADAVGVLDQYFPDCDFFTDEAAFFTFLKTKGKPDYVVICSPNFLHAVHCKKALELGAEIICEKPLVLTIKELETIQTLEKSSQNSIYTILQLRLHPMLMAIKEKISTQDKKHDVIIQYYTPRGKWYHASWKGDVKKSGGIATNIGIHLFDLAYWLFGDLKSLNVEKNSTVESSGSLALEHANVRWHLSIDTSITPKRQLIIDGEVYEFTDGFADLHTASYNEILQKKGFTSDNVKPSIDITERIRLQ